MIQPELSAETARRLRDLHAAGEYTTLWPLVAALREAGWSLAAISKAAGVSRQTPANWSDEAKRRGLSMPVVETPPTKMVPLSNLEADLARARNALRDRREAEVMARHLPRLLELQPLAESLRGPSASNPAAALASREYTALIDEVIRGGVRGRVLAEALGVQQITLHMRRRRAGLTKRMPSQKIPSWSDPSFGVTA